MNVANTDFLPFVLLEVSLTVCLVRVNTQKVVQLAMNNGWGGYILTCSFQSVT